MVWGACLALVLVCLTQILPGPLMLLPELSAVAGLLLLVVGGPRSCGIMLPAIWSLFHAQWVMDERLAVALTGQDILVTGTVCEFPDSAPGVYRFVLEADRSVSPEVPGRIFLSWYEAVDPPLAGQRWQLKVRLKRPRSLSNPGSFDFELWAFVRQIGATGYVRRSSLNQRTPIRKNACQLTRVRQHMAALIAGALDGRSATGYLLALSVGVKNRLSDAEWDLLRRTGTVHLMAISGLHIGLVAALMMLVGRQAGRVLLLAGIQCAPLYCGRWLALVGAFVYSALAGFALPTVRALVMVFTVMALAACRRRVPGEQVLAAALFVVLLMEPAAPQSAGFWLSFYAVTLLLLSGIELRSFAPGWQTRLRRPGGKMQQMFRAQVVLSIGLAPLVIFYFEQVSVVGVVANLFVVPVFSILIVPLTLVGMLALLISPALGGKILVPAARIMEWALDCLQWLDSLPFSVWEASSTTMTWTAVAVIATLILIWPRPFPGRLLAASLLIPLLGGSSAQSPEVLRIVVMDVGQGLAVLVQTARHALVYDTGPAFRTRNAGQTVVLPVLRHFGVRKLDALVISHGDADHIGGASSVLAAFPDVVLIASNPISGRSGRYRRCRAGLEWTWDTVRFSVLHPQRQTGRQSWSENDGSCVLMVESGAQRVLLPGDIEKRAERALVDDAIVSRVSLVIAPHHGSNTSSGQAFVDATAPFYVVFPAGYKNRWGFPKSQVVERWLRSGACILKTAESGAIVFEIDAADELVVRWQHRLDGRRLWTEIDRNWEHRPCARAAD